MSAAIRFSARTGPSTSSKAGRSGCSWSRPACSRLLLDYPGSPLHSAIADADAAARARRHRDGTHGDRTDLFAVGQAFRRAHEPRGHARIPAARTRSSAGTPRSTSLAQFVGGTLGVLLGRSVFGDAFAQPPVRYVATMPGPRRDRRASALSSASRSLMMTMVLRVSNSAALHALHGLLRRRARRSLSSASKRRSPA